MGQRGEEASDNPLRVLLFKVLRVAESLAGGPVFIGNDVVHRKSPEYCLDEDEFSLPCELDSLWPEWRKVADETQIPETTYFIY